jgi:hypothetical protein
VEASDDHGASITKIADQIERPENDAAGTLARTD